MPFRKGQSGNPSGRPKTSPEVREAIAKALPDAVATLVAIMRDEEAGRRDKTEAAKVLLTWGLPKPAPEGGTTADALKELADALKG